MNEQGPPDDQQPTASAATACSAAEQDEHGNNVLATGAVFAALMKADVAVEIPQPTTNACTVRFPFLRSAYRVTVERLPGTESPEE